MGAILYECLCGRPPHSGATYEQIIVKICTKDADDVRLHNPAVSEGIASVVKRALERERDARYADVHQMLDDRVSHSEGALPASLGSDGLRRAVVRTPSSLGSARTLAAVSTVANTPPLENSLTRAQPAGRRGLLLVGVASVAIGGVATATLLGGGSTQPTASGVVPPVTVVVYSSAGPEVSAAPVATAEPSASASAAQLASASAEPGPSAKAAALSRPPGGPRGSGPLATSTPAEPADLQLKLK